MAIELFLNSHLGCFTH